MVVGISRELRKNLNVDNYVEQMMKMCRALILRYFHNMIFKKNCSYIWLDVRAILWWQSLFVWWRNTSYEFCR